MRFLRLSRLRTLAPLALLVLVCPVFSRLAAQFASPPPSSDDKAVAEKDHQRMMDQLGIQQLRPPVNRDPKSPYQTNFDESRANVYPNLPDPHPHNDGRPVSSAKIWWTVRRPQIAELFSREVVGRVPPNVPKVTWNVLSAMPGNVGGVPVLIKKLQGHVDNSADPALTVNIDLLLVTPLHAAGPVPVMMQFAFINEWGSAIPGVNPPLTPVAPGAEGPPWQQQVLDRGWGFALLLPTSFQADNNGKLNEGIIGLVNKGQPRKLDDWGCLRAWAWGASRAMDYFETDRNVDAHQVGIEGHSRFGKAALVAMAYDRRFAIAYISSSGEGGAKLYRHIYGEEITNLAATGEFHWVDGNFLKYAGTKTTGDLPVDAHELIALCAFRPVFIGGGDSAPNKDGWADSTGMFLAASAASPVYELLGKKGLGTTVMPSEGTALLSGDIAFRQHPFGHTPAPNWPTFLQFAARTLHAPGAKTP
jgi:hypothetical protein